MIYIGAGISGAHYNPAVTVALICIKKCLPVDGILYMAFQLLGGILAGIFVSLEHSGMKGCGCPNGMAALPYSSWQGALMEFFATWFLMFVIMGTAVDPNAPKGIYGAAIGGTLTMCIYGIGPITGGALNPFRAYGPIIGALFMGMMNSSEVHVLNSIGVWIYFFPFLGALLAAFMYKFLFLEESHCKVVREAHVQEVHSVHVELNA